jgi:hypothetical protein
MVWCLSGISFLHLFFFRIRTTIIVAHHLASVLGRLIKASKKMASLFKRDDTCKKINKQIK